MTIVNDASSGIIKWSFKLIDAARGVIYDCHVFIIQATGVTGYASLSQVIQIDFFVSLWEEKCFFVCTLSFKLPQL
jgi:hypothetical protein